MMRTETATRTCAGLLIAGLFAALLLDMHTVLAVTITVNSLLLAIATVLRHSAPQSSRVTL